MPEPQPAWSAETLAMYFDDPLRIAWWRCPGEEPERVVVMQPNGHAGAGHVHVIGPGMAGSPHVRDLVLEDPPHVLGPGASQELPA